MYVQVLQGKEGGEKSSDAACDDHSNTTTTAVTSANSITTDSDKSTDTDAADDSTASSSERTEKSDSHSSVESGHNDGSVKATSAGGKCPYRKLASLDSKLSGPDSMSSPSSVSGTRHKSDVPLSRCRAMTYMTFVHLVTHPSAADDAWYILAETCPAHWVTFIFTSRPVCGIWLFAAKGVVVH